MGFAIGRKAVAVPGTIAALATFLICLALIGLWWSTFGMVFKWLADKEIGLSIPHAPDLKVHPFRFLRTVDANVMRALSQGAAMSERAMVKCLVLAVEPFLLAAGVLLALGLGLYELTQYVGHAIGKTVTRIEHTTVIRKVTTTVKAGATITREQFARLGDRVSVLAEQVGHLTAATAGAVAAPFPRIGQLTRDVTGLRKRVKSLEKTLAVGVGAALLVKALGRLGLGWLRCKNVTKAGKTLCGMNPDLLGSLLGSALLLTSAISLRDLARELEEPTKLVAASLSKLIREV